MPRTKMMKPSLRGKCESLISQSTELVSLKVLPQVAKLSVAAGEIAAAPFISWTRYSDSRLRSFAGSH